MLRLDYLVPAFLCCFVISGCSGDSGPDRLETVPASGMVLLDGEFPGEVTLDFLPSQKQGDRVKSASARVAADGSFTVRSYDEGDGIVPGTYKVQVNFPLENAAPPNVASYEVTIGDGGDTDLLLELKKQEGNTGSLMSPELKDGGASTDL